MHPLAAPGTLWVLSRVGKYLVRPQADETSHKKLIPCDRQGKEFYFLFSVLQGVSPLRRRPKGFPLALWKPSGVHPLLKSENCHKKQVSCDRQGKEFFFLFSVSQRVSPLRRRPQGFPVALWKPSGGASPLLQREACNSARKNSWVPKMLFSKKPAVLLNRGPFHSEETHSLH